jgi:hypothetical protein
MEQGSERDDWRQIGTEESPSPLKLPGEVKTLENEKRGVHRNNVVWSDYLCSKLIVTVLIKFDLIQICVGVFNV